MYSINKGEEVRTGNQDVDSHALTIHDLVPVTTYMYSVISKRMNIRYIYPDPIREQITTLFTSRLHTQWLESATTRTGNTCRATLLGYL